MHIKFLDFLYFPGTSQSKKKGIYIYTYVLQVQSCWTPGKVNKENKEHRENKDTRSIVFPVFIVFNSFLRPLENG